MTEQARFSEFDHLMMRRALVLAERGRYTTAPNPRVGCVIVRDGDIVGEGFHYRAGEPHAEVYALRAAGEQAEGATAYVTLEPCSHFGRTPPCAKALIEANVARVVCAMVDPNPLVAGRGLNMLAEQGIEVASGLLEAQARALNVAFIKAMQQRKPFVRLKMAASLDGKTALSNGQSKWITGEAARRDVQHWRAQADAIISASGTVIADDPMLNVRWNQLPERIKSVYPEHDLRQPAKVIVDRRARLQASAKCLTGDVLLLQQSETAQYFADNVKCQQLLDGSIDDVMSSVFEQGFQHLFVEAGATFAAGLLSAKAVDELIIYLAPSLMGGDSRSLLGGLGFTEMADVMRLDITDIRMVGEDIRIIATPIYDSELPH